MFLTVPTEISFFCATTSFEPPRIHSQTTFRRTLSLILPGNAYREHTRKGEGFLRLVLDLLGLLVLPGQFSLGEQEISRCWRYGKKRRSPKRVSAHERLPKKCRLWP